MMTCWNCGTENEPGARLCIQCGAPQARACEVCGHSNPSGARFCSNCGTPFPDAEPTAGDTPVAERAPARPSAGRYRSMVEERLPR